MNDRERLLKILNKPIFPHEMVDPLEAVADYLLDNGVTFAKDTNVHSWIPVTERLPEESGSYLVTTTTGAVTTARFYVGKTYPPTHYRPTEYTSPTKWQSNRNVTHWMPLPEPPKEDV